MTTQHFKSIVRNLAKSGRKSAIDFIDAMRVIDLWDESAVAASKAGCTDAESVARWIEE